jgi:tetratricopeptide (TPR) repeat protein
MNKFLTLFSLALLTVLPVKGEDSDSLSVCLQKGDSCMQQYNTFEALKYYQRAYDQAQAQGITRFSMNDDFSMSKPYVPEDRVPRQIRLKLADCQYKRANYRETTELLKNMPEDSLSHESFRQLAYSYKKQDDIGSFIYWASQLVGRYPMDGEMVAGLTLAFTQTEQPQNGIACAEQYCKVDTANIEVNRALADAYFVDRQFPKATKIYERLLEQGDSTFNTLYSAGMCYTKTDSLERAYQCLKPALWLSKMQHYGAAYRLGVVCVDTKRYDEGLNYLALAVELMKPDTTVMRAITLSQGEGYYLTKKYPEAVEAWKQHLSYYPASIATYFNIANTLAYLINDEEQAEGYYRQFLDRARQEPKPTQQLVDMMLQAEEIIKYYDNKRKK